jgi:ribose 5-phosphate isomerase RpiB
MYHYLPVTCKNIVLINVQNCNYSDIWSNVLNNISNNKTKYHVLRGKGHLFVRALETGRQAKLWRAFLSRFAASANQFRCSDNVHILCLSFNVIKSNNFQIIEKEQKQSHVKSALLMLSFFFPHLKHEVYIANIYPVNAFCLFK